MVAFPFTDGEGNLQYYELAGAGTAASPATGQSPARLGATNSAAAASPAADASINGLIKGLWTDFLARIPALVSGRIPAQSVITATSPNDFSAIGSAVSGNIKASSGQIFSLSCTNLNASTRYLQLFNTAAAPTAGATPIRSFPVYGNGGFLVIGSDIFGSIDAGIGLFFSTGVSWGFSTTPLTYTAGAATDCIFAARWL